MNEKQKKKISRFLSLILRHRPEAVGIQLDEKGWVNVETLRKSCAENGREFTKAELKEVVETNDKKRFTFNEDETKIRANQGHSIDVELELKEETPPKVLYHGTSEKNVGLIFESGLKKMKRHHVHLSDNTETALSVGIRYGKPVLFKVDTEKMLENGYKFYISENGVWLVDEVPPKFLSL